MILHGKTFKDITGYKKGFLVDLSENGVIMNNGPLSCFQIPGKPTFYGKE